MTHAHPQDPAAISRPPNGRGSDRVADYERVAAAIRLINEHAPERLSLDDLAHELGLSPGHVQRLFSRWAGISPARFTNYLGFLRARRALDDEPNLLEAGYEAGLSGPGRLCSWLPELPTKTR